MASAASSSTRRRAAQVLRRVAACGIPPAALCATRQASSQELERSGRPLQRRVADVDELHHLLVCCERNLLMSGTTLDLRTIREWHFSHEYHGAIVVREVDASQHGFHQVGEESVEDVLKRRKVRRASRTCVVKEEASTAPTPSREGSSAEVQALEAPAPGASAGEVVEQRVTVAAEAPVRCLADSWAYQPGLFASSAGRRAQDCYDYVTGESEHHRRECYYVYYETSPVGEKFEDVFIRGTTIASDAIGNFFFFKAYDDELGLHIHSGFLSKATQIIEDLQPLLSRNAEISLSGHSLGGAVAAIVGMKLRKRGFNVSSIVTFGAPKFCEDLDCPAMAGAATQGDGLSLTKRQALLPATGFVSVTKPRDPVPHMPLDDPRSLFVGGYVPAAERQLRIETEEERDCGPDGGQARPVRLDEVPRHLYATLYGYFGFWAMDGALFRHGDATEHRLVTYHADMEEALRQAAQERLGPNALVEAGSSGT